MRFTYCPDCGSLLTPKLIGDEGAVPFCGKCSRPFFEIFSTCVLSVIITPQGEIALIRQSYGQQESFVGVAGYMKCGETAEEAAVREITEETGIVPARAEFQFSAWHAKKDQLMLCFLAFAEKSAFTLSDEVREAEWFTPADAAKAVRPGSIIERLVQRACETITGKTNI